MLMRNMLLAGAMLAVTASAAFAQTVILQPDEEVVVREYIVKRPPPEVVLPDDFDLSVGTVVPEDVVITPLDAPGIETRYDYLVVDGRGVLVDPDTREIVEILD
ncbi:DUF1236 domain-containing protein [Aquamicrobium soli]|jgi:hypothetical protein|uniref:DUF1236 domain-containing protein n=1 Tax=Aquamicrobium soli TaxID=1811518 RepID=A0ABV7KDW7_9HYPH